MRRLLKAAIVGVVAALGADGPATAFASTRLLPDLGMASLRGFQIDTATMSGHKLLRYSAILVDIGQGPFVAVGSRPDTTTLDMTVAQRIYNSDGTYTDATTNGAIYYAGDGHRHWHVRDIEGGVIAPLTGGRPVGALAKHGFCFNDNVAYRLTLPGAPQSPFYAGSAYNCGAFQPTLLTVTMGLSVGWGDEYPASTVFQWIDITGLRDGKYRVTATADPGNVYQEASYANNSSWANIRIKGNTVTVLQTGPGA